MLISPILQAIFALATLGNCYILQELGNDPIPKSQFKNLPPLKSNPSPKERTLNPGEIPNFVIQHAPLVHLYSEERYLPYDIKKYVKNFKPTYRNGTSVKLDNITQGPLDIKDLSKLTNITNKSEEQIFMTALDDFSLDPEWITGEFNKPNYYSGELKDAPAALIVVDKGNGWVDAYWFYFYSFNLGPFVMGLGPFGNHIGDWEHSLVRFYNGQPVILWMSAHGGGGAYLYQNIETPKTSKFIKPSEYIGEDQPLIFSARGTHANYPSTGQHAHDLPWSILNDFTDRGPLWNPKMNYLAYTFDPSSDKLTYANGSIPFREAEYGDWLLYDGTWGDPLLNETDPRQVWAPAPFEWRYIDGPTGPLTKHLERTSPCQRAKWWNFWNGCNVRRYIQFGEGVFDQEGNNTCGHLYSSISNKFIRWIVELVTFGGWICFFTDLFLG